MHKSSRNLSSEATASATSATALSSATIGASVLLKLPLSEWSKGSEGWLRESEGWLRECETRSPEEES